MPKKDIDYSKTIMYKLICIDPKITDIYVGHTTNFRQRKGGHRTCCNNANSKSYNTLVYKFIRDNGGWTNWDMIEIEKYPCNDSNEARSRERYWFEKLEATLNCDYPERSVEEYRTVNKERISGQRKEHYIKNKDNLLKISKEWREKNKGHLIEYEAERYQTKERKDQYIKYREKNKDTIRKEKRKKTKKKSNKKKEKSIN